MNRNGAVANHERDGAYLLLQILMRRRKHKWSYNELTAQHELAYFNLNRRARHLVVDKMAGFARHIRESNGRSYIQFEFERWEGLTNAEVNRIFLSDASRFINRRPRTTTSVAA